MKKLLGLSVALVLLSISAVCSGASEGDMAYYVCGLDYSDKIPWYQSGEFADIGISSEGCSKFYTRYSTGYWEIVVSIDTYSAVVLSSNTYPSPQWVYCNYYFNARYRTWEEVPYGTINGIEYSTVTITTYNFKFKHYSTTIDDIDWDGYPNEYDYDPSDPDIYEFPDASFFESDAPKSEDTAEEGCVCIGSSAGVNTGEYFQSQDFFSCQGPPLSASIKISYRSNGTASSLGSGWRHSYDIGLRNDGNDNIVVRIGTSERLYTLDDDGYTPEVDDYSTFVENSDGTYTLTEKSGLIYNFNETGQCTDITDRNGNQILLEYDDDNLLETVTDAAGRVITFTYNSDGTLATIADPMANTYTFAYTDELLTGVTYPDDAAWSYTYDDDGYLESKTDPEGNTTSYVLDDEYRIYQSTDPNGLTRTLDYSDEETIFTEKDGGEWTYAYDSDEGVVLSKTDPEGFITSYTWDSNKNLLTQTDPGDVLTTYTYDDYGNVLTATDALSRVTTLTYNDYGQILTATGPRGTLTNTYDDNGNLLSVENYDGTLTQFEYNTRGHPLKVRSREKTPPRVKK